MSILASINQTYLPHHEFLKRQIYSIASGAVMGYITSESWSGAVIGACAGIRPFDPSSEEKIFRATAIFTGAVLAANWLQLTGALNLAKALPITNILSQKSLSILSGVLLSYSFFWKKSEKHLYPAAAALATSHISKAALLGFMGLVHCTKYENHRRSRQGLLLNFCKFVVPLGVGIASSHILAQRNWVLTAWAILYLSPIFKKHPFITTNSAFFSAICLWTGHTEKQVLVNTISWLYRNRIFHMGGALVSLGFQIGASVSLKQNIVSLTRTQTAQEKRTSQIELGIAGGSIILSAIIASYCTGIKSPLVYTAISCAAIAFGFFKKMEDDRSMNDFLMRQEAERATRHYSEVIQQRDQHRALFREFGEVFDPENEIENAIAHSVDPTDVLEIMIGLLDAHLLEDEVWGEFPCSITGDPLHHPVLDPTNGISLYEHSVLLNSLRRDPRSPVTRVPLSPQELIPLPALKRFIESRINDQSTINTELKSAAKEELQMFKQRILKYSCALRHLPLCHPVLDPTDGASLYERSAIMKALSKNRVSPATGLELKPFDLIHLPLLERFLQNRIENGGAINEELQAAAEEELARYKKAIQSRLNPKSE